MSGRSRRVIAEQLAEPARLRHGEPARLGARAARDVGDRARARQAEAGRREPRDRAARASAARTQRNTRFCRRSRARCRRRTPRASSPSTRICSPVRSPSGSRDHRDRSSRPASADARWSRATARSRRSPTCEHGRDARHDAGTDAPARRARARRCPRSTAPPDASSRRRLLDRRLRRIERQRAPPSARNSVELALVFLAPNRSQPSDWMRNFSRLRCLCL